MLLRSGRSLACVMMAVTVVPGIVAAAMPDDPSELPEANGQRPAPGDSDVIALLVEAFRALEAGDSERALEHYRVAADIAQSDELRFQALFGLGSAHTALGHHDEAVAALQLALEERPQHTETLYLLAGAYASDGRLDEAVSTLEVVTERAPGMVAAHHDLALLYAHLGWHQQAVEENRRVLDLDPDHLEARLGLATALFHLGSYDDAAVVFRGALELRPDNPRARYGLGVTLVMTGDQEGAIAEYHVLEELDSALANDLYLKIFEFAEDD
jgi:tetratricopeptide (TPR) repeat protein